MLKQVNLAFFFTKGLSLKIWHEMGIIEREITLYNNLARHFKNIFFFTYGDKYDLHYQKYLAKNIQILPKIIQMPDFLYSILLPIFYKRFLQKTLFFKSNQMNGSWTAYLSSLPYGKFILRTGYTWSLFYIRESQFILSKIISKVESLMYRFCDIAFVTSKGDKDYLTTNHKKLKKKFFIMPNWINTDLFRPIKIQKNKDRLIFIGRLSEEKNLLNLIEALSGLDLGLDLIGDGPLKNRIQEKADIRNVSVNFLGKIPNSRIPKILNEYMIFILPSLHEGMPKALLEAMSCGLACIATNVEGSREIIKDGINGLLARNCGPIEIQRQILTLIENENLRIQIGKNARDFIVKYFSLNKLFKKELKFYNNLISRGFKNRFI